MLHNRWVILYIGCLVFVLVATYLGISIWLKTPASLIAVPDTKTLTWIGPKTTPTIYPTPTTGPIPSGYDKGSELSASVQVNAVTDLGADTNTGTKTEANKSAHYLFRLKTTTTLRVANGYLRGTGYLLTDPKRSPIPFAVRGTNNQFIVGYHNNGVFNPVPMTGDTVSAEILTNKIPVGTWVQLPVRTDKYSDADRKILENMVNGIKLNQSQSPNFVLEAYAIELIQNK